MGEQQRVLLAVLLCMLIWFAWFKYINPPTPPQTQPSDTPKTTEQGNKEKGNVGEKVPTQAEAILPDLRIEPIWKTPEREVTVENDLYRAVLTNHGGRLKKTEIYQYLESLKPEAKAVEMIGPGESIPPIKISFLTSKGSLGEDGGYELVRRSSEGVEYQKELTPGLELIKSYRFSSENYICEIELKLNNETPESISGQWQVGWSDKMDFSKKGQGGFFSGSPNMIRAVVKTEEDIMRIDRKKVKEKFLYRSGELEQGYQKSAIEWIGINDRYFLTALIPQNLPLEEAEASRFAESQAFMLGRFKPIEVLPGGEVSNRMFLYLGPKEYERLKIAGNGLEMSIDYGKYLRPITKPLMYCLKRLYALTHNYGIAIIILTVIIKIIFLPLTHKGMKSMRKSQQEMQRIKPLMDKLKERYKDDKERLNREMMNLYKNHKINPLASMMGCIPLMIQMPILIAFYRALLSSIELRHAPFIFWINDLSAKDPYFITPVVMGLTMILQQKLSQEMTPTMGDQEQMQKQMKMMMWFMPIMFTVMFLNFPSGLVIYWLVNNVLTIVQQVVVNKLGTNTNNT